MRTLGYIFVMLIFGTAFEVLLLVYKDLPAGHPVASSIAEGLIWLSAAIGGMIFWKFIKGET